MVGGHLAEDVADLPVAQSGPAECLGYQSAVYAGFFEDLQVFPGKALLAIGAGLFPDRWSMDSQFVEWS